MYGLEKTAPLLRPPQADPYDGDTRHAARLQAGRESHPACRPGIGGWGAEGVLGAHHEQGADAGPPLQPPERPGFPDGLAFTSHFPSAILLPEREMF